MVLALKSLISSVLFHARYLLYVTYLSPMVITSDSSNPIYMYSIFVILIMMEPDIVTCLTRDLKKDLQARQILMGTFFRSKSVMELSEKYDIPMTICLKKVQALERLGMLICDNSNQIGEKELIRYYRSDLSNSHVVCKSDSIYMRFEVLPNFVKSYPSWITIELL